MGARIGRAAADYSDTFEARLESILEAIEALPEQPVSKWQVRPDAVVPDRFRTLTRAELLAYSDPPEIDAHLVEFLAAYPRDDILHALFPLFPLVSTVLRERGSVIGGLVYGSDKQDRYWPLAVGRGDDANAYHREFTLELARDLRQVCGR